MSKEPSERELFLRERRSGHNDLLLMFGELKGIVMGMDEKLDASLLGQKEHEKKDEDRHAATLALVEEKDAKMSRRVAALESERTFRRGASWVVAGLGSVVAYLGLDKIFQIFR